MAGTESYLDIGFKEDKRELQLTIDTIKDANKMFGEIVLEDKFPYELQEGKPITLPEGAKYSQSTNAMVLFSQVASAGKTAPNCPLLPNISLVEPLSFEGHIKTFKKVWDHLIDKTAKELKDKGNKHIIYSSSFGRDDPFTLSWMIELSRSKTFCDMSEDIIALLLEITEKRVKKVFQTHSDGDLREPLPCWLTWEEDPPADHGDTEDQQKDIRGRLSIDHAFPALRYVQLYKCLEALGKEEALKPVSWPQYYLENRLHEQLSKSEIQDGAFDASELVFALEGMLLLAPLSVSRALLDRVFQIITESQERNPYWRPVKPFVATPQGHVLFPISVETASSLLRCCYLIEVYHNDPYRFSQNVDLFKRYSEWLRSRIRFGQANKSDGSNVEFVGWHSEHVHLHPGIHVWETSQVTLFLTYYASMLDRHIGRRSLEAANLFEEITWKKDQKYEHVKYWEEERKTIEPFYNFPNKNMKAYDYALRHFIATRSIPPANSTDSAQYFSKTGDKQYSLLLYGPPGTGKTVFAEEISKALRWPLVTVTPSDFIHGGESEVEARAKMIFEVLGAQSEMVILFDEIDRMILDRSSEPYTKQSDIFQFMTPSMLTKLRNLRKKDQPIFLIATNYEERIDKAAKRQGRLDVHLLIPPPNMVGRTKMLEQLITKRLVGKQKDEFNSNSDNLLQPIARTTRLKVFVELEELVKSAIRELPESEKGQTHSIIQALRKRAENSEPPSISLMSYKSRFKSNDFPHKPFREFFVLLYLTLEDGGRIETTEENDLVDDVLQMITDSEGKKWKSMSPLEKRAKVKDKIDQEFSETANIYETIINGLYPEKT